MRKTILAAVGGLVIGAVAAGALVAAAQPAPGPDPRPGMEGPAARPHWMGWMHRMRGMQERGPVAPRTFALIYRQADRKLTPPDVQKIAEAFLLWNGNHSWKVTEVAAAPDGTIGFALATPEGSVIARFTMDPHTARVTRAG